MYGVIFWASYLPKRYEVATAHVIDSTGAFSDQIDVVVFDRQYSPFVFHYEGQAIIPSESVYAAFEAKQSMNADTIEYAQNKLVTVRALKRTSLAVPTISGEMPPKKPQHIIGGILTFDSDWSPPFGEAFNKALQSADAEGVLDIGCCAAHGAFWIDADNQLQLPGGGKAATAFLLELISKLQTSATVPMIDVRAYAEWLAK